MPKKYKKPAKLKDVGRDKRAQRLNTVTKQTKTKFYTDLRRKAKQANQRLVRLEQAGKKSPAYLAVQAKLEILGREAGTKKGRRFSETGRATYNEYLAISKILDEFISQKTSTVKGYNKYVDQVWQGALSNKRGKIDVDLEKAGITKDQWFEMWSALADKKKDRMFDSSEYIEALALYNVKGGVIKGEEISITEMIQDFENSNDLGSALRGLGVTEHDYEIAADMGVF